MRKWSIESLSLAGAGAVLALLSALGGMTCHDMVQAGVASRQVDRAYDRVVWLEQVRADLYRAEGEQRHYLSYPAEESRTRRDAMLAALDAKLAQGESWADGSAAGTARLTHLRQFVHAQISGQQPDKGYHNAIEHALADAYLDQAGAMIEAIIGAERGALGQSKRSETARAKRARASLITLLLTLAVTITPILLKIRRLTAAHKSAHILLQNNEARYRKIVETGHEGIWLTDVDSRISFANRRVAEMLGHTVAELLGRSIYEFLGEEISGDCGIFQSGEQCGGALRDLRYRRRDGSLGWAIVGGRRLRDEHGAINGALVMATDISERKLAEQALVTAHAELESRIRLRTAELVDANTHLRSEIEVRKATERALEQSEVRLREIISMTPLALFLKNADSRVVLMNEACEQQWGIGFAELDAIGEEAYFPPEQLAGFVAADRRAFATGTLQVGEELIWNAQLGESRLAQTFKKPIFDAAGEPLLLIAMSIDITERKRNEEALRLSLMQLRALSDHQETIKEEERKRIALDIHDDLGQNLMALKIDISMLHARTGASHPRLHQQVGRVLDTIDATIKSVRGIINDLHPSTLELGLCAAVEWLLKQFERRSAIEYRLVILDDSASAGLDNRQTSAIFRVIQESLANIVRHAEASKVEVSLNLTPSRITIVIADNGIGMQPDARGKEASYGLKSIKERIGAFGGELVIDSRKGDGTVLSILMPATAAPRQEAPDDVSCEQI